MPFMAQRTQAVSGSSLPLCAWCSTVMPLQEQLHMAMECRSTHTSTPGTGFLFIIAMHAIGHQMEWWLVNCTTNEPLCSANQLRFDS